MGRNIFIFYRFQVSVYYILCNIMIDFSKQETHGKTEVSQLTSTIYLRER